MLCDYAALRSNTGGRNFQVTRSSLIEQQQTRNSLRVPGLFRLLALPLRTHNRNRRSGLTERHSFRRFNNRRVIDEKPLVRCVSFQTVGLHPVCLPMTYPP